ncbi:uncharacterized protein [Henckelia pumila]|uniref:uncharacterized protein n=1 Tax=Henckelia pumila TaxID=405737 RepID=UPI003C6DE306
MSRGLVGSLPPHLGNLSFLREFILQNNSFYGEIPEEFGRLRRLVFLEFSNNSLSGGIPRNLSRCPNLNYINLIDNNLNGVIIPELGSMYKLEVLGLGLNNLSGTIPPFIGNLTNLVSLALSYCGLRGKIPESIVHLRSLAFITLLNNELIGEIPSGLYNISSIYDFLLGHNRLQGNIPWDIGFTLPKLRFFHLAQNDLHGPIPLSLSNASFLEYIHLFSNNFTGKMKIYFDRLPSLRELFISSNNIEGDVSFIISTLTNCSNLKAVEASYNFFSGSLPQSMANLSSQLLYLDLGENLIQGTIPSGIQNLIALSRISFLGNFLEGPIPSGIGKLSKALAIELQANGLTNEIPSSLGNLTLLNHVDLSDNNLRGTIPQSLSNCTNLLYIDLSFNNLIGSIPQDVISLSSISILFNLAHNAFTGSIPPEVGSLYNLLELDLSGNRLSGVIPSTLGSCIALGRLHLENNSLQGQIPVELGALKGLEDLDLSQNNLSGSIPSFLGNELYLKNLNLSFNELQGEVPTQGVFQNQSAISVEGNKNLCGGLDFLNLPPCSSTTYSKKKHFSNLLKILIPMLGAVVIFLAISCIIYIFVHRRRILRKIQSSMPLFEGMFLRLSYADLLKATDGFSETNFLGLGRFGSVYRGIVDEKQLSIAVKVLHLHIKGASKSFMSECNAIKEIRHRNLLKILSVCESIDFQGNNFKALVYEFMANGSLDKWFHNGHDEIESESGRNLSITQKLNILIDVAYAVEYLHHGTNSIVIHGDLKPSNILLDENMIAHVGDFGLAKVISNIYPAYEGSSSSVAIKGTFGYIPPEYGMTNSMTMKGDVYSFGILVMEMFTNIRPTDDVALNVHPSLHHFVNHALRSQEMNIVDQIFDLHEDTDDNMKIKIKYCLKSVLEIGVACSMELPKDRMMMTDVVLELDKIRKAYLAE